MPHSATQRNALFLLPGKIKCVYFVADVKDHTKLFHMILYYSRYAYNIVMVMNVHTLDVTNVCINP